MNVAALVADSLSLPLLGPFPYLSSLSTFQHDDTLLLLRRDYDDYASGPDL